MAKTIIQTIGPLYGEAVNGTVFGRPNGSIYIPSQNTISISLIETYHYVRVSGNYYTICNSAGQTPNSARQNNVIFVAESQDLANYVVLQVSKSSDFATLEGSRAEAAGIFNNSRRYVAEGADLAPIVAEDTYYLRAVLMSAGGVPVATSDTIELVGVVL